MAENKPTREEVEAKLKELDRLKREAKKLTGKQTSGGGQRNRDDAARRSREQSNIVKEIGDIPPIADPKRRDLAKQDTAFFLRTYFPATFTLPFSQDQLMVLAKGDLATQHGGLFALAMPRGSGKTSMAEGLALKAILFGWHAFLLLLGPTAAAALEMLDSIKTELETNDLLLADFPEVCFPLQQLDGEPRRCKGQTYRGERTRSVWSSDAIVLPTISGSVASGAIVKVTGITGRIRGAKFKRADGKSVRPSMVLIDDILTDASASSAAQNARIERTLAGAVLGLAGPGKKISGLLPGTIIRENDAMHRILSHKLHPEWGGTHFKMVYSFPENHELWERYREIMNAFDPATPGAKEKASETATQFYLENSETMDAGARVAWPERYNPDELSAIQHAMNLLFRDERAFFAEYQNEPMPEEAADADELSAEQIMEKANGLARRLVPLSASHVTVFIDVQQTILYYAVCAFADDFTGAIIDYGTFPDQRRPYFILREAQKTLADETKASGLEGQLYAGLKALVSILAGKSWIREGGSELRLTRCLIDANWGLSTEIVREFCRRSDYASIVTPSHGKGVGASSSSLNAVASKPGERRGLEWRIPVPTRSVVSHVLWDVNFYKSFLHARLAETPGSLGGMSLFGTRDMHRMLADHLTSEKRVRVTAEKSQRTVDEWKLKPGADNHWLDCVTGCCVAASMQGVSLDKVHRASKAGAKKRMSIDEMKKAARSKK